MSIHKIDFFPNNRESRGTVKYQRESVYNKHRESHRKEEC